MIGPETFSPFGAPLGADRITGPNECPDVYATTIENTPEGGVITLMTDDGVFVLTEIGVKRDGRSRWVAEWVE